MSPEIRDAVRVLVIDSHQQFRVELHRALEKRGCRVVCAWDAQDVRGLLIAHRDPIDVAVVDQAVVDSSPGLLEELQRRDAGLRIVLTVTRQIEPQPQDGVTVLHRPVEVVEVMKVVLELARTSLDPVKHRD